MLNMNNKDFKKGFTLIELLVGLSIFSIVAMSLYATFSGGIRINRKAQSLEGIYRDARFAFDILTRDLENMRPYSNINISSDVHKVLLGEHTDYNVSVEYNFVEDVGENKKQGVFRGDKDRMSLVVATDSGLKEIRYYLKSPEEPEIHTVVVNGSSEKNVRVFESESHDVQLLLFVREERPFPVAVESDADDNMEIEILSSSVYEEGLRFSYAKKGEGETESLAWQGNWSGNNNPAGVKVEIKFFDETRVDKSLSISKKIIVPTGVWSVQEHEING